MKAVSSNEDVIAVDTITPQTEVDENTVGQTADGRLVLHAVGEGTATVTVQASLNDWISAEKTFTITVGQDTDTPDVPDTPQAAELTGIAVTTQPDKTVYTEGESFDPAGMVITASYSDDSEKTVDGYTYAPAGALGADVKTITVSYEENGKTVTASLPVTVESKNLSRTRMETFFLRNAFLKMRCGHGQSPIHSRFITHMGAACRVCRTYPKEKAYS